MNLPKTNLRLPHLWESLSYSALTAFLAEFFCTLLFVYVSTSAVTSGCRTKDTAAASGNNASLTNAIPGSCFLASTNLLGVALSFGGAIAVFVYAAASFSGGHLNPAVSVAFFLSGKISLLRTVLYIICQCVGAIVGSALVSGIDSNGFTAALGAANQLNTGIDQASAWGTETVLTCILVFTVFAATDITRSQKSAHLSVLAPFAIGLSVLLAHLVAVPIDGCSINPARSFGPAVVSGQWTHHWIFWVGPIGGGIIAAAIYAILQSNIDPVPVRHMSSQLAAVQPAHKASDAEDRPTLRMPEFTIQGQPERPDHRQLASAV